MPNPLKIDASFLKIICWGTHFMSLIICAVLLINYRLKLFLNIGESSNTILFASTQNFSLNS